MSRGSSARRSTRCGVIRNESASSRAEKAPDGADHQPLLITASDELAELLAQLFLEAGDWSVAVGRRVHRGRPGAGGVLVVEVADVAEEARLDDGLGGEFQGLEPLEGVLKVGAAGHDAVVFEHDAIEPAGERRGDVPAECLAAGQRIGREADFAADPAGLGQEPGVGDAAADAERDERDGVGVDDRAEVGPGGVNRAVEGELRRGAVRAVDRAVGADANDVVAAEAPLVDPGRGDPDRAVVVADREVAARRGRHPVAVDPLHRPHELVARVDQVARPVH